MISLPPWRFPGGTGLAAAFARSPLVPTDFNVQNFWVVSVPFASLPGLRITTSFFPTFKLGLDQSEGEHGDYYTREGGVAESLLGSYARERSYQASGTFPRTESGKRNETGNIERLSSAS